MENSKNYTNGDVIGKPMHISMQYFAEGDPTPPPADPPTPPETPTFDDILKNNKEYQAEFDRRISKGLETQKAKQQAEAEKILAEKLSEAEKLAKMNADQKATYEREQAENKFKQRESDITRRELTATAKETLISKGLPMELSDCLNYADADTCNKSIEGIAKAFEIAVTKAVDGKLKQNPPPVGMANNSDPFLEGFGATK